MLDKKFTMIFEQIKQIFLWSDFAFNLRSSNTNNFRSSWHWFRFKYL